jgi:cytochrome c biogenesis protein CcdA/glutaredoxin
MDNDGKTCFSGAKYLKHKSAGKGMSKNMARTILLMLMVFVLAVPAMAQNYTSSGEVDIVFFYGQGCPHCAREEVFLEDMQEKYSLLKVHHYEVYSDKENRELMMQMADAYGKDIEGVPTTFINGKMIVGFSDAIGRSIEHEVRHCVEFGCSNPLEKLETGVDDTVMIEGDMSPSEDPGKTGAMDKLTIGAVIAAAAVDAINPCAFAVLIILLTTILAAGSKRKVLGAGLAFTLSIFLAYFLMGLGLFSAIQAAGLTRGFYAVVATLALLVGLFNLKDYLWYGKWFIMEVPRSWRPRMKAVIKGVTSIPGAFLVGFVISLFLLPCTSGPYIVILGLLAQTATRGYAMLLLLLYNFIFVLPMLVITFAIYFGFTTTAKAEEWRTRKLRVLHLIAGVIMVILGIVMFGAMILGYV